MLTDCNLFAQIMPTAHKHDVNILTTNVLADYVVNHLFLSRLLSPRVHLLLLLFIGLFSSG